MGAMDFLKEPIKFSIIGVFMLILVPGLSLPAFAAGNAKIASTAVSRYIKGLQNGKCDSLFDMVSHYDEMISMERKMKPKALWPQIDKQFKEEWNELCHGFSRDISNHDGSYGGYNYIYVTPKTRWNIIETRPGFVGGVWDVFVKVSYVEQEAPCERKVLTDFQTIHNEQDEPQRLKSRIYGFSVYPAKGKIFVSVKDENVFGESFEFYPVSCKKKEDDGPG